MHGGKEHYLLVLVVEDRVEYPPSEHSQVLLDCYQPLSLQSLVELTLILLDQRVVHVGLELLQLLDLLPTSI